MSDENKTPKKPRVTAKRATTKTVTSLKKSNVDQAKKPHGNTGKKRPTAAGRKPKTTQSGIANTITALNKRLYVQFSEEVFMRILEGLSQFDQEKQRYRTLTEVLSDDGMPSHVSFYRWLDMDQTGELRKAYSYVSLACVDAMADEQIRVAYDAVLDPVVTDKGIEWHKMSVPRSKLIVDTLQWQMSRKAPEKWSGTVKLDVTGDVNPETMDMLAAIGMQSRQLALEKAKAHAEALKAESGKEE